MKEANDILYKNWKENYSQMLPILIPIDSIASQAASQQLGDIIKKSSLIPERHQNSKFVYDAYLLIAKARLLKEDYRNAIETCKYVNTNADDDNQRHAALITLMRAYTEQGEYATGLRVAEVLKQEKKNTAEKDLFIVIKSTTESTFKNAIDLLDAMVLNDIPAKHYAEIDITSSEINCIENFKK